MRIIRAEHPDPNPAREGDAARARIVRATVNRFGPYRLIRPLEPVEGWERYIALHEQDDTDHLIYRHPALRDGPDRRRLLEAVRPMCAVDHAHLLGVTAYSFDQQERLCLVTPYTGNQEGLVTLSDLVERRSGRLEVPEVARCVEHLLGAVAAARAAGISGGPVQAERVQVDRRGSLRIELYGLPSADRVRRGICTGADEVRAIGGLAVWLLTGIRHEVPPSAVARIAGRSARGWENWLEVALDAVGGFESPEEALAALPGREGLAGEPMPEPVIRPGASVRFAAMVRRFRKASASESRTD